MFTVLISARPGPRSTVKRTASPPVTKAVRQKDSNNASEDLQKQITQLHVTIDGLEKERDFYFAKLRDVEIIIQTRLGNVLHLIQIVNLCIYYLLLFMRVYFMISSQNICLCKFDKLINVVH
jgi:hypothetical protein